MMPASSSHSRSSTSFRLTPTDEAMLLSCGRYHDLTHEQWRRLFADDGKLHYLQRRSRELSAQDYLVRLYIARPGGTGKAPSLFAARWIAELRYCLARPRHTLPCLRDSQVGQRCIPFIRYRCLAWRGTRWCPSIASWTSCHISSSLRGSHRPQGRRGTSTSRPCCNWSQTAY